MIRPSLLRRLALGTALLSLSVTATLAVTDQKFTSSTALTIEARTLVQLLEQAHYNRDAVHSGDYAEVIPNFMADLDGQRLFFLASDKAAFGTRYGKNVYWNISGLGNIDAAYDIFSSMRRARKPGSTGSSVSWASRST